MNKKLLFTVVAAALAAITSHAQARTPKKYQHLHNDAEMLSSTGLSYRGIGVNRGASTRLTTVDFP